MTGPMVIGIFKYYIQRESLFPFSNPHNHRLVYCMMDDDPVARGEFCEIEFGGMMGVGEKATCLPLALEAP